MAASQAYKGDVSEVLMGHETGIYIQHGEPCTWSATWTASNPDYTEITFVGTSHNNNNTIFENSKPILKVPLGMLIGQQLTFHKAGSSNNNFSNFYNDGFNSRVYRIVDHTVGSTTTQLKIVPPLEHATSRVSGTGDALFIHSLGMPTLSASDFVHHANAASSKEVSTIDQFIGLASHMVLPDTTVELLKHHVVGLGRQPAIQQPGKVHHQGGQVEMPLHSPRWLYYSLGREVVDAATMIGTHGYDKAGILRGPITPGQTYADVGSLTFGGDHTLAVGDYVLFPDTTLVPTVYYKAVEGSSSQYWPSSDSSSTLTSDSHHFDQARSSEIRRVVAIEEVSSDYRLFLDDPIYYQHETTDGIQAFRFASDASTGSPHVDANGRIDNPVHRLLFSAETVPSFCIEHSIRNRDVGSFNGASESSNTPGSSTDSKQLTRIFRGCKVVEWELTATTDAEVKYRCIFNALSCYTDTGRLDASNPGDRYTAHRMFQNTASDAKGRKESGIALGSEKPFMFYNGTITAFDQNIGYVSTFELRGKTGVETFHTIGGTPVPETVDSAKRSTKQVPYGGTRNASVIREGREEFELEMDIIIRDPLLWHELRTHREVGGTVNSDASIIEMVFTKPSTGTDNSAQLMRILIDDYVITQAPIPVPDDKGLLHSRVMIHPKNIKVISTDTLFHC
jgi:hypothetical protein|tara:strand:- start:8954 stop:10987 length:2034 start_codon:yes stop_codon:yes gene_type:complete